MTILVLNCGSSSLKYQLINMETEEVMASGKYERIGEAEAFITHKVNGQKIEIKNPAYNHSEAIDFTLKQLTNPEYKVIDSLDEINAIGHRLVHGGEKIAESGIKIEIECERMRPLSTLLYCIAWNNGEYGNVTEDDRVLCNYAYEIAKLIKDKKRMEIYQRWLTRR